MTMKTNIQFSDALRFLPQGIHYYETINKRRKTIETDIPFISATHFPLAQLHAGICRFVFNHFRHIFK